MKRIVLLALAGFVCVACASIIKGGHQQVPMNTDPTGASIVIYDDRTGMETARGVSPYTVTLKRGCGFFKKCKYRVVLEKGGCERKEVRLEGSPNGWYIGGNILLGGLIGWFIVDPATGAMWTLQPDALNEKMEEVAYVPKTEGLHVLLIPKAALPTSLQDKLQLVY